MAPAPTVHSTTFPAKPNTLPALRVTADTGASETSSSANSGTVPRSTPLTRATSRPTSCPRVIGAARAGIGSATVCTTELASSASVNVIRSAPATVKTVSFVPPTNATGGADPPFLTATCVGNRRNAQPNMVAVSPLASFAAPRTTPISCRPFCVAEPTKQCFAARV